MNLKTTLIAGALAAALGTGAAVAQNYSENPPPPQQQAYGHHRHGQALLALIREEVSAGRISQKEGALLEQKIKEMKRERRAERQARMQGYGQGTPPVQQ